MIFLTIAKALNMFKSVTAGLVILLGLVGICVVIFLSITKFKKINPKLAIVLSTLFSCFLMVPIISVFNNYVEIKIEGEFIDELEVKLKEERAELVTQASELVQFQAKNRIKSLENEILNNQKTIAEQAIKIEALHDKANMFENAQLSMQSFQQILEIALLEVELKQVLARKDPISEIKSHWLPPFRNYRDEVLVVIEHDITAKFGVDLNEVKIATMFGNIAVISGIQPKYIGAFNNLPEFRVEEIRRNEFNGDGTIHHVDMQNDRKQEGINRAENYEKNFQNKLREELSFMDSGVAKLAEEHIKIMLDSLRFTEIKFDNANRPNALPLMEYLKGELKEYEEQITNMNDSNANLVLENIRLESEIRKIEIENDLNDSEE